MEPLETAEALEALRRAVWYDPADGSLTWRGSRPVSDFASPRGAAIWHGRFAGKPIEKRTHGYVVVALSIRGVTRYYQGHRVAWALYHGAWPPEQIDHINGVRDDNRIANLREATHAQNQLNRGTRHGPVRSNKSGYRGVYWAKQSGKWRAQIQRGSYRKVLGEFASAYEAHLAYEAKARELDGEFHHKEAA